MPLSFRLLLCLNLLLTSHFCLATPSDNEKLNFIRTEFQQNADYSRTWQYGWTALFGISTAVKGGIWAQTSSNKEAYDNRIGFITGTMGVADMIISAIPTHRYAAKLNDDAVTLQQAERWLAEAAAKEQRQRTWVTHAKTILVNGIAGLVIAIDDDRSKDGFMLFATSVIASEAKMLTSPKHMTRAYQAYQRGELHSEHARKRASPHWQLAAAGPMLHINYLF